MKILYLVHDLSDAAVLKRCHMLRAGGATVTLAGFTRRSDLSAGVLTFSPIILGLTKDAQFLHRMFAVLTVKLDRHVKDMEFDVVIARNLEMLAVARHVARNRPINLVYESLDIHRLLLRDDIGGLVMRYIERRLSKNIALLLTSSPAFVRNYFVLRQCLKTPTLLVQNKVFGADLDRRRTPALAERPLTIGWFGILRCRKSLSLLAEFSRRMKGKVQVVLRGKPAYHEFDDFDAIVAKEPYLRFEGPYEQRDLEQIYSEIDVIWAIDFFEEGLNSAWLLPNRLYEGCYYGCIPLAMSGTETARFLKDNDIGLALDEATPEALVELMGDLKPTNLIQMKRAVIDHDLTLFAFSKSASNSLVAALATPHLKDTLEIV